MMTPMVIDPQQLQHMDAQQLRALAEGLMAKLMSQNQQLISMDQEIHFKQTKIDLLTHEIARYKRLQFAAKSEKLHADQRSLLDETLDADLAALEAELQALSPAPAKQTVTAATPKAKITSEAAVALSQHGTVAPVTIHHRTDFAASMIDGRTVMEVDPGGKSAAEVTALWNYISERLEKNFRRTVFAAPNSVSAIPTGPRPMGGFGRRVAGS